MKFRNKSSQRVTFKLRGREYAAEPGDEVSPEVPDKLAFAIKARGLPLESVGGPTGDESIGPPEHPEARLWYDRAHEERRLLMLAADENNQLLADRERLAAESATTIKTLRETHAVDVDALKASHAEEIAKLKASHEAELAQLTAPAVVESQPDIAEASTPAEPPKGQSRRPR